MSFHVHACFYLAIAVYKEKKEYKEKNKITYFLHEELKFLLHSLCMEIARTDSSCWAELYEEGSSKSFCTIGIFCVFHACDIKLT